MDRLQELCEALLGEPPARLRAEAPAFACAGVAPRALLRRVLGALGGGHGGDIERLVEEVYKVCGNALKQHEKQWEETSRKKREREKLAGCWSVYGCSVRP